MKASRYRARYMNGRRRAFHRWLCGQMHAHAPNTTATRPRKAPARRPRITQPIRPMVASAKTRMSIHAA
jgi:hypothetical protein